MRAKRQSKAPAAGAPSVLPEPQVPQPEAGMSAEVLEFVTAIDDYKRKERRLFPNWSEVLQVLKSLGYKKSA